MSSTKPLDRIISLAKRIRRRRRLELTYSYQFAFIGVGDHAVNNLYPVINYLGIPLKYIVTQTESSARLISKRYRVIGTTDLDMVFRDDEVKGVFICVNKEAHFSLISRALKANKDVLVEKPPCKNLDELEELITIEKKSSGFCMVGLQKRYSPYYNLLKQKIKEPISYCYRYITGSYPEGNPATDLFIHGLDVLNYIFGEAHVISKRVISKESSKNRISIFLHLCHKNIVGSVELSTNYSWSTAKDELMVNTQSGVYTLKNSEVLKVERKSGDIFRLPREKLIPFYPKIEILMQENTFIPVLAHNPVYGSGYFDEINIFSKIVEGGELKEKNITSLIAIKETYQLLSNIM